MIKNRINGKIYIGSSVDVFNRLNQHKSDLIKGKHHSILLQRSFNKWGLECFEFHLFYVVEDLQNLLKQEQYYIEYFQSANPRKGYNISPMAGSSRGIKRTPEYCLAQSLRLKGKKQTVENIQKRREGIIRVNKERGDEIVQKRILSRKKYIESQNYLYNNKEYLFEHYINQKKSIIQIGKEIGCDPTWVTTKLKQFEIPMRTKAEQNKIISEKMKLIRQKNKFNTPIEKRYNNSNNSGLVS